MAASFPFQDTIGTVYLIHYSAPTAAGHQHYLGWTADIGRRFAQHKSGFGAAETRRALSEGLKLTLAQTWRGTPSQERHIKEERRRVRRGFACLCPFCDVHDEAAAELVRGLGAPTLRVYINEGAPASSPRARGAEGPAARPAHLRSL
jgi:predicted GIY-YIG superfamily endonuclease